MDSTVLQSLATAAVGAAVILAAAYAGLSAYRDIRKSRHHEYQVKLPDQLVISGGDVPVTLKSLTDLLTSLSQRQHLDQVQEVVAHKTKEVLSASYTALFIREGAEYALKSVAGLDVKLRGTRLGRDSAIVRYLEEVDKPAVHLTQGHQQLQAFKKVLPAVREVVCVHLAANSEAGVFGFLLAANKTEGRSFSAQDVDVLAYLGVPIALHLHNAALNQTLESAYTNTIIAMANALEARDAYSRGHSERVAHYAVQFASYLNIDAKMIRIIHESALLHDLGKIGIPDFILQKPGRLDAEEQAIMRQHPEIGYNILKDLQFMQEQALLVRHHHEHYDGHGYPHGLSKDDIPEPVVVIGLCDVWDALLHDRPHRPAHTPAEALALLNSMAGTHFDPRYVRKFVEFLQVNRPSAQSDTSILPTAKIGKS